LANGLARIGGSLAKSQTSLLMIIWSEKQVESSTDIRTLKSMLTFWLFIVSMC